MSPQAPLQQHEPKPRVGRRRREAAQEEQKQDGRQAEEQEPRQQAPERQPGPLSQRGAAAGEAQASPQPQPLARFLTRAASQTPAAQAVTGLAQGRWLGQPQEGYRDSARPCAAVRQQLRLHLRSRASDANGRITRNICCRGNRG